MVLGICKTGGLISLCLISSNVSCCSFCQINGLPFLVKSYMGFNIFGNSGQNTISTKLLHPFTLVGGCGFCIASSLSPNGLTQTFCSKSFLFEWNNFFSRDKLSLTAVSFFRSGGKCFPCNLGRPTLYGNMFIFIILILIELCIGRCCASFRLIFAYIIILICHYVMFQTH